MLSEEQVRHVAKLARVWLSDEEVQRFSSQLSRVFEYVDILNELDTDEVEIATQVTGLVNVMDVDEVIEGQATGEELLKCSPLPVVDEQILVKKTL